MYEYTDIIIRYLDERYIELYSRLKSLVSFDELNVMQSVNQLYREQYVLVRKMFVQLANHTYKSTVKNPLRELDEQWVDKLLKAYDPTTKYVFNHEEDRKAARLIESLIASTTKTKEIDAALRSWSLMSREYAIRITDEAVIQAFIDDGETYARWVTEKDERVCTVCEARDGKIYEVDKFPPKPHIGCRCQRERIDSDDGQSKKHSPV